MTSCRSRRAAPTIGEGAGSASSNALDRLESLPPVELIKFGDDYWVVDGHNRVAAALYNGQVELDAVVEELRLPGHGQQAHGARRR